MESVKESAKPLTKSSRKKTLVTDNESNKGLMQGERSSRIAVSAYYRAQARGFTPGHELDDWLAAEAEEKQ